MRDDMKKVRIKHKIRNRQQLHDHLIKELMLPAYYGRNLDALNDCLQDIHEDISFEIESPDCFEPSLREYLLRMVHMLNMVSRDNSHIGLRMVRPFRTGRRSSCRISGRVRPRALRK